jgi:cation diffusion facilitator family transporter
MLSAPDAGVKQTRAPTRDYPVMEPRTPRAPDPSLRSVLVALLANTLIAAAKGIAAALTGSSALLAETLHTVADTGNEVFLYVAIRRSEREPDPTHPLGYGPERYYWALLAAIGMFAVGGAVSVWEGFRALVHPAGLEDFWVGVAVLLVALTLDGASRTVAVRTLRAQARGRGVPVKTLLRETPDPAVTTVYFEDSADVLGALLALAALVLHKLTGSAVPDAVATLAIGCLLVYLALRLIRRNRQLLTNQAVPERYIERIRGQITAQPGVEEARAIEAVYLGPGQVLVAADVRMDPGLDARGVANALVAARARIRDDVPVVARLYLTPVE